MAENTKSDRSNSLIPREFIHEVLTRIDLIEIIEARIPLQKKSHANYFARCPFHSEKTASFSVCQTKQFYHCFGCGAHGNAIDFLMNYERLTFPEAIQTLAQQAGIALPAAASHGQKTQISPDVYALMARVTQFYQAEYRKSARARDYVKERHISDQIAEHFQLGFAPHGWDSLIRTIGHTPELKTQLAQAGMIIQKENHGYYDRFRERLMFPIQDRRGRIIGFGGRTLGNDEPKYLNSPETPLFQKGHELFGLYQALQHHTTLKRLILVEGYMDVIALHQAGITEAVATLGTATTVHHLQRIFRYTTHIIFCFDGDEAGRTAAWRALTVILPLMQDHFNVRFMFLPEGDDPDTFVNREGKNAFDQASQNALSFSQFFFQTLQKDADLSTLDGRVAYVKKATQLLNDMPDTLLRHAMLQALSNKTGISMHEEPPQTSPQNKPQANSTRQKNMPSLLTSAMTLLVQNPTLAQLIDDLPLLSVPAWNIFVEIVTLIRQYSIQNTSVLLEYWRNRKEYKRLLELAQVEWMISPQGIQEEWLGILNCLKKQSVEETIRQLLAKAASTPLSSVEKKQLHDLIVLKNT